MHINCIPKYFSIQKPDHFCYCKPIHGVGTFWKRTEEFVKFTPIILGILREREREQKGNTGHIRVSKNKQKIVKISNGKYIISTYIHDDKPYVLVLNSLRFDTYNKISLPLKLQRSGKKEIKLPAPACLSVLFYSWNPGNCYNLKRSVKMEPMLSSTQKWGTKVKQKQQT